MYFILVKSNHLFYAYVIVFEEHMKTSFTFWDIIN